MLNPGSARDARKSFALASMRSVLNLSVVIVLIGLPLNGPRRSSRRVAQAVVTGVAIAYFIVLYIAPRVP